MKEESEKVGLKLNIQKMKIMASGPISSVQFSRSVVSDSLQPHGLQPARLPCPSPTPRAYSCPSVSDAIQPSHPLSSPSPHTFNLSQHQGLFQGVSSLHQVAEVLEFRLQHQSFQCIFRTDFLWMDWLDLLAVQGTLQHQSWKASILHTQPSLCPALKSIHDYLLEIKTTHSQLSKPMVNVIQPWRSKEMVTLG